MTHNRRILVYKIIALLFVILVLFMSSDGIKNPEINHRSLCTVMGIDGKEGEISASVQIIVPEPQGQGKQMIVNETGTTLSDALDKINISIGQKVELGHCGLIVLGNEYIKNAIFPELLYLLSSGKTNPDVNLVVAKDMEARELLSKLNNLSKLVSEGINNIVAYADSGVHVARSGILSFLTKSFGFGKSGAIPCVELGTDKYGGDKQNVKSGQSGDGQEGSGGQSGGEQSEGQTVIKNIDTLIMLKDGKYKADLSEQGTRGIVWLDKESVTGLVLLNDVKMPDETIQSLSCKLIGKKVKTKASFIDGKPVYRINISVKISIEDKYKIVEIVKEGKSKVYNAINCAVIELIKQQIDAGINESKNADCDIFCINEKFNKFCHKEFMQYGDVLKDVLVDYNIKVNIL